MESDSGDDELLAAQDALHAEAVAVLTDLELLERNVADITRRVAGRASSSSSSSTGAPP